MLKYTNGGNEADGFVNNHFWNCFEDPASNGSVVIVETVAASDKYLDQYFENSLNESTKWWDTNSGDQSCLLIRHFRSQPFSINPTRVCVFRAGFALTIALFCAHISFFFASLQVEYIPACDALPSTSRSKHIGISGTAVFNYNLLTTGSVSSCV